MADIDILIEADGWHSLPDLEQRVGRAAEAALREAALERKADLGVAILLTDDDALQRLNAGFRGQDKPTNVLSFPAMPNPGLKSEAGAESFIGDIAIALETTAREAADEGKTLGDHLSHLVVHGVLHLLGYDHAAEAEAEAMETREITVLATMGIANPYTGAEGGATR